MSQSFDASRSLAVLKQDNIKRQSLKKIDADASALLKALSQTFR
ncbi:hypothetical protein [Mesorhizobium sp.]|nr:hypothetical protein [Mesorhizobium sp.]